MLFQHRTRSKLISLDKSERRRHRQRIERRKVYSSLQFEQLLSEYVGQYECLTHAQFVTEKCLDDRQVLLLRHDVDHDDETALKMAGWEAERGLRATYCILHSAHYYGKFSEGRYLRSRQLVHLCEKLHALGHEISFHNNLAVLAIEHAVDPAQVLRDELEFLRGLGIPVVGTATHGDRLCHELNFRNSEIFREAVNAEFGGPREVRGSRGSVRLGELAYRDFDLLYEAYDVHRDLYITDSGGHLRCVRDTPGRRHFGRVNPCSGHVIGILTHPIWWDFDRAH